MAVLALHGVTAAQSATMTVPGLGQVLAGNASRQTLDCQGGAMTVNGNDNRVTLKGRCLRVSVNGNGNTVTAGTVGQIIIHGRGNAVRWHRAISARGPPPPSPAAATPSPTTETRSVPFLERASFLPVPPGLNLHTLRDSTGSGTGAAPAATTRSLHSCPWTQNAPCRNSRTSAP